MAETRKVKRAEREHLVIFTVAVVLYALVLRIALGWVEARRESGWRIPVAPAPL